MVLLQSNPVSTSWRRWERDLTLAELIQIASTYRPPEPLPVEFAEDKYQRRSIYRDDHLEIVVICFGAGQSTSIHDHQGSNCVVNVVDGLILETMFECAGDHYVPAGSRALSPGDVSGLDGERIHQIANLCRSGSVLLNFYSPPFQV
jgi:cysteine dioxygenase